MANNLNSSLRIATINVRGLVARRRQYQLSRLCMENELDLIAVQETKGEKQEQTDHMVSPFTTIYNVCVCHAVGKSAGCAVLISKSEGIIEEMITVSENGRLIVLDFSLSGKKWRLVCVYAPNNVSERCIFFEHLKQYLPCERHLILLGDFNCVCFSEDRSRVAYVHDRSVELLSSLVVGYNLEDVGHTITSGGRPQFTHTQQGSQARLDRVYVSLALIPLCNSYNVIPVSFSDHSLVSFNIGNKQKQPRFNWHLWKLNAKLLNDEPFVEEVEEKLGRLVNDQPENYSTAWEQFKNEVKMAAIERASIKRRNEMKNEKDLQRQLEYLLNAVILEPKKVADEIKKNKSELELIDNERYKAAMIRARGERLWLGEAPNKRS